MSSIKRTVLAATVLALVAVFAGAGQASAAMPWWKVRTMSVRPTKAGNEASIVVEVANLGDAVANRRLGFLEFEPLTVTDKLPPGLTATKIYGEGGGAPSSLGFDQSFFSSCSLESTSCTYELGVMPYDRLVMEIDVKMDPGAGDGENEVSVSGGTALPVVSRQALTLEGPRSYGVESYELTPEEEGGAPDTQAGSHPFQLTTSFSLNMRAMPVFGISQQPQLEAQPYAMTKDLRFKLPPGLIGNPTPLPKCNMYVFTHPKELTCPNNTVVGVAVTAIQHLLNVEHVPLEEASPLYSLEPSQGEPARFGFQVLGLIPVILDTSVRTGGDYGVVVTVPNITSLVPFMASQVTFWGVPSDPRHDTSRGSCLGNGLAYLFTGSEEACPLTKGQPFLIMPTACTGPPHTTLELRSWSEPEAFTAPKDYAFQNSEGEPFSMDGCNRLQFAPSIKVAPDGEQADSPTGVSVDEHIPQDASLNPDGLAESTVKDTRVTLPAGVALDPSGADGLSACGLSEVGLEVAAMSSCPEASKVGTVEVSTPLLPNRLEGAAYLAQQYANPFGSLVAMYIVVRDPVSGVIIKVAGQVSPDPVTGQLTATFNETPELPFEDLVLHFFGGSRAPLATPSLCGSYTTTATIAPWSGNPPVDASSTFDITSGPDHAPCADPLPFAPTLHVGSSNIQAGEFTPFSMTMSREDDSQNLDAITLHMPNGLYGTLTGVELCPEPKANEGLCGPNSLIGETTISVGVGGNPYTVKGGKVYITGPYEGAPFGLSIVNPAKAGPFDVGQGACDCVVVRAKVQVNPITAALTITSDTTGPHRIPTILAGIPLQIRHVNVTVNRKDFTFNPTNCEKMAITGDLTSSEGASSTLAVPFQVTNCATLAFKPRFSVSTPGKTSRANGAGLDVRLTYPKSIPFDKQTNIAKVKVELPKQLPSRLSTLQKACPDNVFESGPQNCPAASRVGEAVATTPIIPESFTGPAYFVSHGGQKFPELIIVLHGYSLTVELHGETFISKQGITSSTFRTVPDVPIGSFELKFPQGPNSALAANGNLCTTSLRMPTTFVAQNGMEIHQSTPITATGCAKVKHRVKHKRKKHRKKK